MTAAVSTTSSRSSLHVFVDANIFLSFFHFTKSNLDTFRKIFASDKDGAVMVYLTQQVRDEIDRNRENRLKDAMATFRNQRFAVRNPSFVQDYQEARQLSDLLKTMTKIHGQLLDKVEANIKKKDLLADQLMKDIFASGDVLSRTDDVVRMAIQRMHLGNPPGKHKSIGDAINWLTLLQVVPSGQAIHVISEDGDFFSPFDKNAPNPFLSDEWTKAKTSDLYVYRGLEPFIKEHFDKTGFVRGLKTELIERLEHSPSFATTHDVIAELDTFSYYSLTEALRVLDAVTENNQVHWIVTDPDVACLLARITRPYLHKITDPRHQSILAEITGTPGMAPDSMEDDHVDDDLPF